MLTKLHYASPLWLHDNLEVFKKFWNNVVMRTSGAMLNPHREVTELALHLPPLEVQLNMLTTKFLCKCLTSGDFISSLLLQIEGSQSQFLPQLALHLPPLEVQLNMLQIEGSQSQFLPQLALHLPPLEVQLNMLTTKFLCKCLTSGDFISSLLLQIEGSQSQFLPQLISLKEFIAWKKGFRSAREVELTNQDHVAEAFYSKREINM